MLGYHIYILFIKTREDNCWLLHPCSNETLSERSHQMPIRKIRNEERATAKHFPFLHPPQCASECTCCPSMPFLYMLGAIKPVSVWQCTEFQCAKIPYFVRRMTTLWLDEGKEQERQYPIFFSTPCKTCCTAESILICFYRSLTAPHVCLGQLIQCKWALDFSLLLTVLSLYQGWSAISYVMVCLFRLLPKSNQFNQWMNHLLSSQEVSTVWGHILYLLSWKYSSILFDLNKWLIYNS